MNTNFILKNDALIYIGSKPATDMEGLEISLDKYKFLKDTNLQSHSLHMDGSETTCGLCMYHSYCSDCPVGKKGHLDCQKTPYGLYRKALEENDYEAGMAAIDREIEFLESLYQDIAPNKPNFEPGDWVFYTRRNIITQVQAVHYWPFTREWYIYTDAVPYPNDFSWGGEAPSHFKPILCPVCQSKMNRINSGNNEFACNQRKCLGTLSFSGSVSDTGNEFKVGDWVTERFTETRNLTFQIKQMNKENWDAYKGWSTNLRYATDLEIAQAKYDIVRRALSDIQKILEQFEL